MCADERLERRSTDVCCCRVCVSFRCVQMRGLREGLRMCADERLERRAANVC